VDLNLKVGLIGEVQDTVTLDNTAKKYGSGSIDVYATPAMIGLIENAALSAVDTLLPSGFTTVGIELRVKHLAATPIGMTVKARAELVQIDSRRLVFKVEAFDEVEKIGEGEHERFVVQVDKFMAKSMSKKG
jgi:fluoroacetyl-CoA thioesterase